MAINKDLVMKGAIIVSLSLPLLFAGPALYHWVGAKAFGQGDFGWGIVTLLFLFGGAGFGFYGLRTLVRGFLS